MFTREKAMTDPVEEFLAELIEEFRRYNFWHVNDTEYPNGMMSNKFCDDVVKLGELVRIYREANQECVYDLSLNLGCPQCMKSEGDCEVSGLVCSFCERPTTAYKWLLRARSNICICSECVDDCTKLIEAKEIVGEG